MPGIQQHPKGSAKIQGIKKPAGLWGRDCIRAFATFFYIKNYFVVRLNLINQTVSVYKSLCSGLVVLNKAKTFFLIEELYSSCDLCAHC